MKLIRYLNNPLSFIQKNVISLGNFDGVHQGHQMVLKEGKNIAKKNSIPHAVLTFEPHPKEFFFHDSLPFRLTPCAIKLKLLNKLNIDYVVVLKFNYDLSSLSPELFIQNILINSLHVDHVVVGHDFVFGKNRQGNADLLKILGKKMGFNVTIVKPIKNANNLIYSSTHIRDYLKKGQIQDANKMLGRPWQIQGRVIKGDQRGRTIGFPTANIFYKNYLIPTFGVYACFVKHPKESHQLFPAITNIGYRPTIHGQDLRVETHIFDFSGDLYDQKLSIMLIDFIRPEKKFDSLQHLQNQIIQDCQTAQSILQNSINSIDMADPLNDLSC
ncbi:MAG: bifunctional riboflavin kinase/FAD synthetase [Alphaproteobacteria bacterium]|nr:bifunctional riboflavin kinase/FAD synthetase [Alphaproteobacteria bacterium]